MLHEVSAFPSTGGSQDANRATMSIVLGPHGAAIVGDSPGGSAGGTSAVPTTITVANEATDTTCFLAFFTAATGDLGPKTNANLAFNSNTGVTSFGGNITPQSDGASDLGTPAVGWGDVNLSGATAISWAGGDVTITHSTNALAFEGASSGYSFDAVIKPVSSDGAAIGSTSKQWSDLFLAEGGVINWDNGDVTITQTNNVLSFAGATTRYEFDANLTPSTSDGAALGTTVLMFSDLFLASGAVINLNNGDVTLTHSSNALDIAGATSSIFGAADGQLVQNVGGAGTGTPISNSIFDFRLSLASGTAVTTTDQTSKSTIYLTPYIGNRIALYDGTRWLVRNTAEISVAIGTVVPYQAYDVWCYDNSGTPTLEILEWANATVTMTIASPCVVTWTGHGMSTGNSITFTTSGALPTGVSANTQYFVTVVDANTFKLSTSRANVAAGTFINSSGSQSGTHTGHQPQARQTALTTQDGVLVKSGATTRRYCGTFIATTTTATADAATARFLANWYNRVRRKLYTNPGYVDDGLATSYTTTSTTFVEANGGTGSVVEFLYLTGSPYEVSLQACFSQNNGGAYIGIGIDTAKQPISCTVATLVNLIITALIQWSDTPGEGYHFADILIGTAGSTTGTYYADLQRQPGGGGSSPDPRATAMLGWIWG